MLSLDASGIQKLFAISVDICWKKVASVGQKVFLMLLQQVASAMVVVPAAVLGAQEEVSLSAKAQRNFIAPLFQDASGQRKILLTLASVMKAALASAAEAGSKLDPMEPQIPKFAYSVTVQCQDHLSSTNIQDRQRKVMIGFFKSP